MSCSESRSEVTGTRTVGHNSGRTGRLSDKDGVGAARVNTTGMLARADGQERARRTPPGTHGINERHLVVLARARENSSFLFQDQEPILKGDEHSSTVQARGQNDLAHLGPEPYRA